MMKPCLSIVMPLFNKSAYVGATLDALLPQLDIGDEIIVVDDCSTDDGFEIAKHRLRAVPGAQCIRMAGNAGPGSARNAGARVAKGSHLLFFDADDIPSPILLKTIRQAILGFPDDHVFTYGIAFQARGEEWSDPFHEASVETERRHKHAFVADHLRGRTLCTASSTCVTKSTFFKVDGFQEGLRYCEDPELWARLSAQYDVIAIARVLAIYQDVPQSLSYGLRGRIGSVNPYVDTLLELSLLHGNIYKFLAKTMIFKNLVFSKIAGVSRGDASRQLHKYRGVLGNTSFVLLWLFNFTPSCILIKLASFRVALRKHLASPLARSWNQSVGKHS